MSRQNLYYLIDLFLIYLFLHVNDWFDLLMNRYSLGLFIVYPSIDGSEGKRFTF